MCKSEDSSINSLKYVFVGVIDVGIGNRGDLFQKSTILEKLCLITLFSRIIIFPALALASCVINTTADI